MLKQIKSIVGQIPYPLGKWLAKVPFAWRLGKGYSLMRAECRRIEQGCAEAKEEYALEKFRAVFEYARQKFPCYRELYEK